MPTSEHLAKLQLGCSHEWLRLAMAVCPLLSSSFQPLSLSLPLPAALQLYPGSNNSTFLTLPQERVQSTQSQSVLFSLHETTCPTLPAWSSASNVALAAWHNVSVIPSFIWMTGPKSLLSSSLNSSPISCRPLCLVCTTIHLKHTLQCLRGLFKYDILH